MEKIVILRSPFSRDQIKWVESTVQNLDCICSCYETDKLNRYSTEVYVKEKHLHDGTVQAVLDRNIVSSLTSAARNGKVSRQDEREALALLCFLRISEIDLEPFIALTEYNDSGAKANPTEELHVLRVIDNIPNDNLLALARGGGNKGQTVMFVVSTTAKAGNLKGVTLLAPFTI